MTPGNLRPFPAALWPLTLGLAHGFSDGVAGLVLGALSARGDPPLAGLVVIGYNLLAFGAQPVAGWLTDRLGQLRRTALASLALMGAALVFSPAQPALAAGLAGLASAVFHVSGGALALRATPGRAAGPGLFAAPGVLGLALGLAGAGQPAAAGLGLAGLLVCAAIIARFEIPAQAPSVESKSAPNDWLSVGLLLAIALRSAGWSALQFHWQGRPEALLLLGGAAAAGKLAGGHLADRLGGRRWMLGALLTAAPLLAFFPDHWLTLGLGAALLQSTTPAALTALARGLPGRPAAAAGLALGFAVALGGIPVLAGYGARFTSPVFIGGVAGLAGLLFWLAGRAPSAPQPPPLSPDHAHGSF